MGPTGLINDCRNANPEQLYLELWVSLASLLRSYTAVHGLSDNRQARIEHDEGRILASQGDKWLELRRSGATITWNREDGNQGTLVLMESGRLRSNSNEEEMDLASEAWARDLMSELPRE